MGNNRRVKCSKIKKRHVQVEVRGLRCSCSGGPAGCEADDSTDNGNPPPGPPGVAAGSKSEGGTAKPKPPTTTTTSNGTGSPLPQEEGEKEVSQPVDNREYRYDLDLDARYSSLTTRRKRGASHPKKKRSCALCGSESGLSYCSACHKVSYCGKDHQKEHWKDHKGQCFPCSEMGGDDAQFGDPEYLSGPFGDGPYYRATKDIEQYGIILEEEPLMTGPGCCLNQEYQPLCLGCTNPIKASQKCFQCSWPLCDISCEVKSRHTEYECDIFKENGVKELFHPFQYDLVRILRCLLMKKLEPATYEELIQLFGAVDQRKTMECLVAATTTACIFIRENCKLVEFDRETIDTICGIVDLQTQVSGPHRTSMQIFTFPTRLAHSCTPNCRLIESTQPHGEHSLMLTAIRPIKEGTLLTFSLLDILLPTYQRQLYFRNMYYFMCTCDFCENEDQNGTFFSAVKCTQKEHALKGDCGYLLPRYPTDLFTTWYCTHCDFEADGDDLLGLLNGYDKVDALFREKLKNLPTQKIINDIHDRIKGLQKRLHPGNYFVWKNRMLLLSYLNQHMQTMDKPKTFCVIEYLYKEGFNLAKKLLMVFESIDNGAEGVARLEVGILMYHLFGIHWAFHQWATVFGISDHCNPPITPAQMDHFANIANDAMQIFDLEADGARHLIDQILFMKHNFNVIQTRLDSAKSN